MLGSLGNMRNIMRFYIGEKFVLLMLREHNGEVYYTITIVSRV